jgi:hypothetical protein
MSILQLAIIPSRIQLKRRYGMNLHLPYQVGLGKSAAEWTYHSTSLSAREQSGIHVTFWEHLMSIWLHSSNKMVSREHSEMPVKKCRKKAQNL